jgi:predicted histidine transporter YuiF (NhaC family)
MSDEEATVAIVALAIPLVFLVGLFVSISLGTYFKHKTNVVMSERLPGESLVEWHRANAQARIRSHEKRQRGTGIRISGLLVGLGLGTAIGCIMLACSAVPPRSFHGFDQDAIATFLVISISMLCGGAGMIGAYFLERRLDRKGGTPPAI